MGDVVVSRSERVRKGEKSTVRTQRPLTVVNKNTSITITFCTT